ncbi:hypothetical protein UlMin_000140 [Ulmus minor]
MRRSLREKRSGISSSSNNENEGCTWGILQIINYHHWRHSKKKQNKRRDGFGRLLGNDANSPTAHHKIQEQGDAQKEFIVEQKMAETPAGKHNSFKSRVKALVGEEMKKRRGTHSRSTSCPVRQLTRTDSIHRLKLADTDPLAEILALDDSSPRNVDENEEISSAANKLDSMLRNSFEESNDYEPVESSLQDKKPVVDSSLTNSKEYLDALDIISVNKDYLVRVLQDPGSPLASHFCNQQALSAKMSKSETFPSPCSSGRTSFEPGRLKNMQSMVETSHNSSPVHLKNKGETHTVIKRFKDLKQKMKHVIKENRKERQRIAMDAVLHKVPCGQNMEKEIDNQFKNITTTREGDRVVLSPNERKTQSIQRASSFNKSIEMYCQMYETSFTRDAKHQTSEGSNTTTIEETPSFNTVPKYFTRILSLPELKSDFDPSEESSNALSDELSIRRSEDRNVAVETSFDEISEEISVTRDVIELTSPKNEEEVIELDLNENDYGNLTDEESEPNPTILDEQDTLGKQVDESSVVENEKLEKLIRHSTCDISHLLANTKDKAEFSYVRDILEQSGFSGNGFLGAWQANAQPVNPLVYNEGEGCLVNDLDCSGNEEGKCDHLLLFDLINEVLMEIYRRSYSYCPFPLSDLSKIRPMPAGPYIFREVWRLISWYLRLRPEVGQSLDYVVSCDLARSDGWMNLQFESECVGLEIEEMIFDDLLDETVWEWD